MYKKKQVIEREKMSFENRSPKFRDQVRKAEAYAANERAKLAQKREVNSDGFDNYEEGFIGGEMVRDRD